jgi:hypothetical protein
MLAVVTAEGWVLIVAAVGAVLVKVIEKVFDRWQAMKAAERAAERVSAAVVEVAAKVETKVEAKAAEVKCALEATDAAKAAHLDAQDRKLDTLTQEVAVVKDHTNGILDKLVDAATDKPAPPPEGGDVT